MHRNHLVPYFPKEESLEPLVRKYQIENELEQIHTDDLPISMRSKASIELPVIPINRGERVNDTWDDSFNELNETEQQAFDPSQFPVDIPIPTRILSPIPELISQVPDEPIPSTSQIPKVKPRYELTPETSKLVSSGVFSTGGSQIKTRSKTVEEKTKNKSKFSKIKDTITRALTPTLPLTRNSKLK